jgi:chromosome condensin MukBEF complex kleisin-like MukF subunit
MKEAPFEKWRYCILDVFNRISERLKTFISSVIDNLRSSDSIDRISAVQFETNAIYRFVPFAIYSRKKQMPFLKEQLFISI